MLLVHPCYQLLRDAPKKTSIANSRPHQEALLSLAKNAIMDSHKNLMIIEQERELALAHTIRAPNIKRWDITQTMQKIALNIRLQIHYHQAANSGESSSLTYSKATLIAWHFCHALLFCLEAIGLFFSTSGSGKTIWTYGCATTTSHCSQITPFLWLLNSMTHYQQQTGSAGYPVAIETPLPEVYYVLLWSTIKDSFQQRKTFGNESLTYVLYLRRSLCLRYKTSCHEIKGFEKTQNI